MCAQLAWMSKSKPTSFAIITSAVGRVNSTLVGARGEPVDPRKTVRKMGSPCVHLLQCSVEMSEDEHSVVRALSSHTKFNST